MIRFEQVTVRYDAAPAPVLHDVDLEIPDGELALVIGRTGAGKSTLLKCVNGLVPHFTGGSLAGRVSVDGRDTATYPPRELADVVGYVGQHPAAGFVTDTVEEELAYTMESLAIPPAVMRHRIENVLDTLGLTPLRRRTLAELSSGQQQRVAIGSVLTAGPRVLVLDEPTSALDPPAAEEVLAALTRLVHDLGLTVLLAEHRLERVVQYADRIITVTPGGHVATDTPAAAMAGAAVAPAVVELGRLAGWRPLPLSVRDARRAAAPLRQRLADVPLPARRRVDRSVDNRADHRADHRADAAVTVHRLVARYNDVTALSGVDLSVAPGEVVAVMGRNGAGKSTLLMQLVGLMTPAAGRVEVAGTQPHLYSPSDLARHVGLVPAEPADLFFAETVAGECGSGPRGGHGRDLLERLCPGVDPSAHPRDLSEGQRLALALAVVLAGEPPVLLLDEPTRGLDYPAKARLVAVLREHAAAGVAVLLATHDVELAAEVATRTVVLADGEIVADGPTAEVVTASPAFAPQVAKILHPLRWLTVSEVAAALQATP